MGIAPAASALTSMRFATRRSAGTRRLAAEAGAFALAVLGVAFVLATGGSLPLLLGVLAPVLGVATPFALGGLLVAVLAARTRRRADAAEPPLPGPADTDVRGAPDPAPVTA